MRSCVCALHLNRHHPRRRMIQYSEESMIEPRTRGVLDTPPSRSMTAVGGASSSTSYLDGIEPLRQTLNRHHPRRRMIQYSEESMIEPRTRGVLDTPPSGSMTAVGGASSSTSYVHGIEPLRQTLNRRHPRRRMIQYSEESMIEPRTRGILDI